MIEERWTGIGYDVQTEHLPTINPETGQPTIGPDGQPETAQHTTLILIHAAGTPDPRIIRIPFTEETRQELIRKLTGGIIIPGNGNTPHLPFGSV